MRQFRCNCHIRKVERHLFGWLSEPPDDARLADCDSLARFQPIPDLLVELHAARDCDSALARFASCVLQSGIELPYRAIKSNIGDSLNVLIQLERRPRKRLVSEVIEMRGYDSETDIYDLSPVFTANL